MSKMLEIPEDCGAFEWIINDYYDKMNGYNKYAIYLPSMLCNNNTLNEYLLKHTNINQTNNDDILSNEISIPYVIIFHGWTSNTHDIISMHSQTNFPYLAEKYNMIIIVPQALGDPPSWNGQNCCGNAVIEERKDELFVSNLIYDISTSLKAKYNFINIHKQYIHLFGVSNGAFFVSKLTWLSSVHKNTAFGYKVTSGIAVAGYVYDNSPFIDLQYYGHKKQYIPIMQYHGLRDIVVNPFGCGCNDGWTNNTYFGFKHDCCCGIDEHNHDMCVSLDNEFERRIKWNDCNIPNITDFYENEYINHDNGKKCYYLDKNGKYNCKTNIVFCYLADNGHPMPGFEHHIDVTQFRNDIELFWRQSLCNEQNGKWNTINNTCQCNDLDFDWDNIYYCFDINSANAGSPDVSVDVLFWVCLPISIVMCLLLACGIYRAFKRPIPIGNLIAEHVLSEQENILED